MQGTCIFIHVAARQRNYPLRRRDTQDFTLSSLLHCFIFYRWEFVTKLPLMKYYSFPRSSWSVLLLLGMRNDLNVDLRMMNSNDV